MINEKEDMNQPKLDVGEEEECCRLVYEDGRGFALFHPFKSEEGRWLNIDVEGRVGFDVVGANGRISIKSPTHYEPLVSLDFATSQLSISAAACASVPSFYIVDVAVAAVLTVATVEGRRLRAIQEDLERIIAYESCSSPKVAGSASSRSGSISAAGAVVGMNVGGGCVSPRTITPPRSLLVSPVPMNEKPKVLPLDYSFAAAMGRQSDDCDGRRDGKLKQQQQQQQQSLLKKKSIASKLGKAFKGAIKSLNCKSASQKMAASSSPDPAFEDFQFQFQSFSFPPPPEQASR